jgi:hypothetical protein
MLAPMLAEGDAWVGVDPNHTTAKNLFHCSMFKTSPTFFHSKYVLPDTASTTAYRVYLI